VAAPDVVCTLACGATTGIGAALYVAKVEAGSTCVVAHRRRVVRRGEGPRPRARARAAPPRGQARLESFISHRMPLDEVNQAFALMEPQDGIRSVLTLS
jgi:Zn-dependent alcohol dehydrogenase